MPNSLSANDRLALALKAARLGTFEWVVATGEGSWDERLKEIVGFAEGQQASNHAFFKSVHRSDVAKLRSVMKDAVAGSGEFENEFRIVRRDNQQVRWVRLQGVVVFGESTRGRVPEQIVGTLLDVTQQKEFERSLEDAKQLAETASEAKTQFLANMSHEIRTPMTAILGYLEVLARHLKDPDDLNCVAVIRRNGKFLLEIINDILDVSKIEAGKFELELERFRPDRLIDDVRSLMSVRATEKKIELSVEYKSEIPETILCDQKRLKQALVNVVGNAIKFTDEGSVKICVGMRPLSSGGFLQIDVIDTGIGIGEKQQSKLFQPFMQVDASFRRRHGGTGLGLVISQRLTEMLGGGITVESTVGCGSTFSVSVETGPLEGVKLVLPSAIVTRKQVTQIGDLPPIDGRILIVDDRRDIRLIAEHFIGEAGGVTATAENGREAIDCMTQAEQDGAPFDLVVIDMQMPVMDGYEATRRLRAAGYRLPVIALTAHAMADDRHICLAAGCTDYIAKPLDGPPFIKLIAKHLSSPQEPDATDTRSVLIVDDDQDSRQVLAMLLEMEGHQVKTSGDGYTAIELSESFNPDVVLLDLNLPDMSGFDVLKSLKHICTKSRFVAMTGHDNPSETKQAGFDDHVLKPVDAPRLSQIILGTE